MPRPTPAELEAAEGQTVRDVIAPNLDVLFVGFNPGLYSAVVGHHFARPGNRFWKALHLGGFTDKVWPASDDGRLPQVGAGLTNLVPRATRGAADLSADELRAGARRLARVARRYRPSVVAVLGVTGYRTGFERRRARLGPQPEPLGPSRLWVLPNPSGLNAHHQADDLGRWFADLRRAI